MAGILSGLFVAVGQVVAVGEELAIVEAMKMRFSVTASTAGRVNAVSATVGDRVTAGQVLLTLDLLRIE
jgi:biotin carboxyl carrier protein